MAKLLANEGQTPVLLALDGEALRTGPAYRVLAEQLRRQIRSGALPPGTRLPASRQLAAQLAIARNTVIDAYADLAAEGLIEGQGRHGTLVMAAAKAQPALADNGEQRSPLLLRRLPAAGDEEVQKGRLNWRLGQAGMHTLPIEVWRNACREAGRHLPPPGYGDPRGEADLRQAVAEWLQRQRSVTASPAQIVITPGTSQALALLARVLVQPGDLCCCEDPGYPLATQALQRAGAVLRYVGLDEQGLLVESAFSQQPAPLLLHLTPAHQYPLGVRLSGPRRRALLAAARSHGTLLIENEYDHEFIHAGQMFPPLFASAPDCTLLLSTFAKALSPALRLGFIAGPPAAMDALAAAIERERLQVSWPTQKTVAHLLSSGELDRHLRRVRRHYAGLRATILHSLAPWQEHFTVSGHEGGLHVLVRGTTPAQDASLQTILKGQSVAFDAVSSFAVQDRAATGLLFGYGHMSMSMLDLSLQVLTAAMQQAAVS